MNRHSIRSIFLTLILLVSPAISADGQDNPARLKVNKTMLSNFVKSLIIPGWGQYANGHKIKAIAFLTAEIGGLYGYQVNYSKGEEIEKDFKIFGNLHWDYNTWALSDDGSTACGNLRTHAMPTYEDNNGNIFPVKDHHFYENISKYPEFICGWDDIAEKWEEDGKVYTPNKYEYIDMRTESNDLYKNAQLATTLIMVNHLISAFDAALGTDVTSFESTNFTGKFYINPLNATNSIRMEVKF